VLALGLTFEQLYSTAGLSVVDQRFVNFLLQRDAQLAQQLAQARSGEPLAPLAESNLLIALAPVLEDFLALLFGIESELAQLQGKHTEAAPLFLAKRKFVQRVALRQFTAEQARELDGVLLQQKMQALLGADWTDLTFAQTVTQWQAEDNTAALDTAAQYAAWAVHHPDGRRQHRHGVLFKTAQGVDPDNLVPHIQTFAASAIKPISSFGFDQNRQRHRAGFDLTDSGCDLTYALDQANYCIWCHAQGRDSCSKGLKHKPKETTRGAAAYKTSAGGSTLAGCPLEERISEFQQLKAQAVPIGALAVICIDNPMAAATGHRICNDCMKACIYQKQEAVNIPQLETRTLKDVLALPWGFEIYSLLTRWNPLNLQRPIPCQSSGKRVLVVGMGPAGYTLAHHLLNEGHQVVGVDGLKIEPLPAHWVPNEAGGGFAPIKHIEELNEDLSQRVSAGFGGVAEYGITVRWDKNYLRVIRLLLQRRAGFALFGGVRFGGTLTATQAFDYGFDHIALAVGAGKPTTLNIPNGLAKGVRAASDFLMGLQLTGAAKADSIANLQVRLPVVVIGGGLTAIDTATESLAYYPVQVEKFLSRHEALVAALGEAAVRQQWSAEETETAEEFIAHAQAIRAEIIAAARQARSPQIAALLTQWGGVTIAYRKRLVDSPAYTLNHEEVEKALEEGIRIAQCVNPHAIEVDQYGAAKAIVLTEQIRDEAGAFSSGEQKTIHARTIFIAAGTSPNTVLAREEPGLFSLAGKYFQTIDAASGQPVAVEAAISKPELIQVLTHKTTDNRFISFVGDVHPSFFGNVVKAMASAKNAYPVVTQVLAHRTDPASKKSDQEFIHGLREGLGAHVHAVRRLTPTIVEVVVKAPWAARAFEPGQFYRLQNFETTARAITKAASKTTLQMEGLALTGAWVDKQQGLLSTIVLEMGGSADLCSQLQVGEPVVLMGPTGAPTHIAQNETVMLVGGGLGNAVLFSIGAALRAAGCKVLYFAGYKKLIDRYKVQEIEAAADVIVWCSDEAPGFTPSRPQDASFVGNIVQAITAFGAGRLQQQATQSVLPTLSQVQRIIAIGSDRMMAAVAQARHNELKPYLQPKHHAIGSINSPMQCMMKEVCAQCLQQHIDPITGKTTTVFSCFNQDQPLDLVDWNNLRQRLSQNSLQEKQTALWIKSVTA
jgi:NADPH-dependent glutamate synthase beta subunit-like oxidoreductase/NAD(P)H-flavin reductase